MKPCRNCGSIGGNIGCDTCGKPLRERKALVPSDATDCSPSCAAPETLAAWGAFEKGGKIVDLLKHAIRMETERDAMKAEAYKYIRLWDEATKELETLKFGAENA